MLGYSRTMSDPEVSIVIVSWNVCDLLVACLRSLSRYVRTPYEVIVIDNHSADTTVATLRRDFPQVKLIVNAKNEGFAKANNQGWQKSVGRYVCFLNPDTEFIADPFPAMISYLQANPPIGCLGPSLLNADRTIQPSVRRFPRFLDQALILLKLRPFLPNLAPLANYYLPSAVNATNPQAVDQLMGAMLVLPRAVLSTVGSFDEGYWIWFEEVDLCQRLHRQGYQVVYFPKSELMHVGGRSFAQHLSLAKQVWLLKSLGRYINRYWKPLPRYALFAIMPVSYLLTMVQSFFKPK